MTQRGRISLIVVFGVIAVVLLILAIPKLKAPSEKIEREALRAGRGEADPATRIEKLEVFLKDFPEGRFRGYAHSYIFNAYVTDLADTAKALSYARTVLASGENADTKGRVSSSLFFFWGQAAGIDSAIAVAEAALGLPMKDPSAFNEMCYDLAERGVRPELAVELGRRAVVLAKEETDRIYCYDSLGWAYFRAGKLAEAETALLEAKKAMGDDADETTLKHLAEVQLAVGKTAEGVDTYLDIMSVGEFEETRAKLDSLYVLTRGSSEALESDIRARRQKRMTPAPDFTLADMKGDKMSLSSFRGKVVALNFMSPT
ncbi:MAG: hypothetical protein V2A71_09670 [Candidatus Eisenbacteria bacterium]